LIGDAPEMRRILQIIDLIGCRRSTVLITGETGTGKEMVARSLADWQLNELDCLFIENVGNLVCPSSYDLGENLRIVLMSVTEGEDKPLKYPTIFNTADVALLTKMDLASAVEFDFAAAYRNIESVRPGMEVLEVSAKTGAGLDAYQRFLEARLERRVAVAGLSPA